MAKSQQQGASGRKRQPGSTTSLGKKRRSRSRSPGQRQVPMAGKQLAEGTSHQPSSADSTLSGSRSNEYGSQASPMRVPMQPRDLVKVTILGAAGGIGQPLALLLMLHSEYIHHLALYDLVDSVHGIGLDLSHVDRQVKVTTHLGPDSLAEAVKGARVVVIPAGLAQRPGMSRDDLFASNAKIMYNIAKCCAQTAPEAALAIITNPVNSLVPLTCEVYARYCAKQQQQAVQVAINEQQTSNKQLAQAVAKQDAGGAAAAPPPPTTTTTPPPTTTTANTQQQANEELATGKSKSPGLKTSKSTQSIGTSAAIKHPEHQFEDCFRRIFGVTTLDVVRASTLTAKSVLFKNEPNGLFTDPGKIQVPVVGGHAGKTIMPLLSQATPKLDRKRLQEDKSTTLTLIDSIQQAGIDVLNAKKGKGSATLAMAYAACRFTVSLLRAQAGEQSIVECAYVRHPTPCYSDLEYFAAPLLLGKDGYMRSMAGGYLCPGGGCGAAASSTTAANVGPAPASAQKAAASTGASQQAAGQSSGGLLPYEQQMLEEGARELRLSIVKGEDFAREHLSSVDK